MKYPAHLYTIVVDFGPNIASFQQHHADKGRAAKVFQILKDKASGGKCIEGLQMWYQNKMVTSYIPNPPMATWLPPPDSDGVRRIPEHGAKRPKRLPDTTLATPDPNFILVI